MENDENTPSYEPCGMDAPDRVIFSRLDAFGLPQNNPVRGRIVDDSTADVPNKTGTKWIRVPRSGLDTFIAKDMPEALEWNDKKSRKVSEADIMNIRAEILRKRSP